MFLKNLKKLQNLIDTKIKSSTSIVVIIALLVVSAWELTNQNKANSNYMKASIIEAKSSDDKYIIINWIVYWSIN